MGWESFDFLLQITSSQLKKKILVKHVCPSSYISTLTKMYDGRLACCPLVSHTEYALRAQLKLEKGLTGRRTDGCQTVTLPGTDTAKCGQHN